MNATLGKRKHSANLRTSRRLQKVAVWIYSRTTPTSGPTTLEAIQWTGVANMTAAISELRDNGIAVESINAGKNGDGMVVYRYRIESLPVWLHELSYERSRR